MNFVMSLNSAMCCSSSLATNPRAVSTAEQAGEAEKGNVGLGSKRENLIRKSIYYQ